MSAPSEPINKWEFAARQTKASKLFKVCADHGITAEDATAADEHDWWLASQAAGVKAPSRETQALVIEMLMRAEMQTAYAEQSKARGGGAAQRDIPTRGIQK